MSSITIRNLETKLKSRLRSRAQRHGRSVEDEARDILQAALNGKRLPKGNLAAKIRARFKPLGGVELHEIPREAMRKRQVSTMIVLDTNIISELIKLKPDARVERWAASEPLGDLFITTITEAELRYGIALLSRGRRREKLNTAIEEMLSEDFHERILPFDSAAALVYAEISANRRQAGRPISQFDAQIAAIVRSRGAKLATRNSTDFELCGIDVINPWNR